MKYFKLLFLLFFVGKLFSQDLELYEKNTFIFENDTLNYRILKPLDYDPNKQYPLHLVLHGSGERGNDNISQLIHGGKLFLNNKYYDKNYSKNINDRFYFITDFLCQ